MDNDYRIITSESSKEDFVPFALKVYWQDDIYVEEEIEITSSFKDIEDLYSKRKIIIK